MTRKKTKVFWRNTALFGIRSEHSVHSRAILKPSALPYMAAGCKPHKHIATKFTLQLISCTWLPSMCWGLPRTLDVRWYGHGRNSDPERQKRAVINTSYSAGGKALKSWDLWGLCPPVPLELLDLLSGVPKSRPRASYFMTAVASKSLPTVSKQRAWQITNGMQISLQHDRVWSSATRTRRIWKEFS